MKMKTKCLKATLALLLLGCLTFVSGCSTNCAASSRSSKLVILKANYGVGTTKTVDVTAEVSLLAQSDSIHLHPQWALGVDPVYGATMRITIAYKYEGRIEVASFNQFEEFVLPSDQ
jgi:hypothetical protein